jgi:hypothetical protein
VIATLSRNSSSGSSDSHHEHYCPVRWVQCSSELSRTCRQAGRQARIIIKDTNSNLLNTRIPLFLITDMHACCTLSHHQHGQRAPTTHLLVTTSSAQLMRCGASCGSDCWGRC